MKTTKRLLSILLMLTMLVSMFTVMAFADEKVKITECEETHDFQNPNKDDEHFDAVTATCTVKGTPEYYQCHVCGGYYWNGSNGAKSYSPVTSTYAGFKVDPSNHVALKSYYAKKATCTQSGNKAYSYCADCGKYFDELGKETTQDEITIPATGHELTHHDATAATCTTRGTKEYWECKKCGKYFADKDGKQEITEITSATIPHKGIPVSGKAATCTDDGLKPVYYCSGCEKYYQDETCTTEATDAWRKIPALGHALKNVKRVEPTTTKDGNIEYWYCEKCGKYFSDADGKKEIKQADTVLPKIVEEEEHELSFNIGENVKLEKTDSGITIDETRTYQLKKNDPAALKFTATSLKKGYKVAWKIDNGETYYTSTITIAFKDLKAKSTLKIWVVKTSTDDLDLTVKVSGFSNGDIEYKYNGGKVTDLETREKTWTLDDKDEYVKFWLYPKTGYKAVVQLNDGKKYTYSYNESLTIDYEDLDGEDGTLYVSFVKKGSSEADDYPTLTFDITGTKHGKVYRGTREYENGDVISIKKNDKMTFKAKADKGYVAVWTYKGDTYVGDEYTVKMGSTDAKLYVEFMDKDDIRLTELPFRDVSKRDWYYDDVVYVYRKGYMDGMSSTRFGGELNTTRGQIVTILWRLTGEPRATKRNPFNDVSSSQYYYDAISWAYDAGVVDGFDAHTFKPDQNVTREQLAAILYRYAEYMNLSTSGSAYLAKYKDADKIASWAYDAMAWANYHGLINGTSATRIDPKGYATRAQIAAILHRFAVEFGA